MSTFYESRALDVPVSSISIGSNFDVDIALSPTLHQVTLAIETKGDCIDVIHTQVNSFGKLFVSTVDNVVLFSRPHMRIAIPHLQFLHVQDSVHVSVTNLCTHFFTFEGVDKTSTVLSGAVENLSITALNDAVLKAAELEAQNVMVSCHHDSKVLVYAKESISGNAYGRSQVLYKGAPRVQTIRETRMTPS